MSDSTSNSTSDSAGLRNDTSGVTIGVAIANYRDMECMHTLRDMFAKAAYPERIHVGVCDQYDEQSRLKGQFEQEPFAACIHVDAMPYEKSQGSGWAWNRAHALCKETDFTLQIHAHMRFLPNWDVELLAYYAQCPSDMPVITYYSPPYTPPNKLTNDAHAWRRVCVGSFGQPGDAQLVHLNRTLMSTEDPRQGLYPSPFIIFNFIFAKTSVFQHLPYDPHIYFWGEEIAFSARLWTHGYDIWQLPNKLAYHQWFERDKEVVSNFSHRQLPKNIYSYQRICHLFGLALPESIPAVDDVSLDIAQYGFGRARTIESWLQFSGVDLVRRRIAPYGRSGMWDLSVLEGYNAPQESQLAGEAKSARLSPMQTRQKVLASQTSHNTTSHNTEVTPISTKPTNQSTATTPQAMLVCLSAYDNAALKRTVESLFTQAAHPQRLRVVVAWHGRDAIALLDGLDASLVQRVDIQHISNQHMVGNAYRDAVAKWQQEPLMLWLSTHVECLAGWDEVLAHACDSLDEHALITSAVTTDDGAHYVVSARMADTQAAELLLRPGAVKATDNQCAQTPLISGDLLAGRAQTMLHCLADPFMDYTSLAITHSARLWTHGMTLVQPEQPVVRRGYVPPQEDAPNALALQRAQHLLGLHYTEHDAALIDLDQYGHGDARDVESFWQVLGVNADAQTIHPDALNGQWQQLLSGELPLLGEQMVPITSQHTPNVPQNQQQARIFVQIASYRDEQCQHTVKDLFEKATHPDRIFVGICWQTIPQEDQDCFRITTRPEQVRVVHFDARESKGANWGRVQAGTLRSDEEYTLLIDAHTRFEPDWDQKLVRMLENIPVHKPIISTYPTGYDPISGECKSDHILRMAYREFVSDTASGVPIVKYRSYKVKRQEWPNKPFPTGTLSSNFLFARSKFFDEVPLDPYIYFFGDDLSLMVRAWTHGWDVFSPNIPILYHLWDRKSRPLHWKDHEKTKRLVSFTERRVGHITGMQKLRSGAPALKEIEIYNLGSARSLREFEAYIGIGFGTKILTDKAIKGSYSHPFGANELQHSDVKTISATGLLGGVEPFINPQKPLVAPKKNGTLPLLVRAGPGRGPIKTLETSEMIVYDNFLPEDDYEALYRHATMSDYKHINTTGNVSRVWNLDNGFPLRSSWNRYYRAPGIGKKTEHDYPQNKPTDAFIESINRLAPDLQHLIGAQGIHWAHYSLTSWLYPQNTGLSLHNDGAAYSGAYVYYLNKEWRIHWGGLLLVMDSVANQAMEQHKIDHNAHEFHRNKWLHETEHNDYAMEAGFARTVFPKRNRIVFISPEAFHIVTKILPAAGDNVRMTLAGFFNRGPLGKKQGAAQPTQHPLEVKK